MKIKSLSYILIESTDISQWEVYAQDVVGLMKVAEEMNIPLEFFDRSDLATIKTPNPSKMVEGYEGTASVSEAAAIKSSGGNLIVEKQKFPPDLTIAIARIQE